MKKAARLVKGAMKRRGAPMDEQDAEEDEDGVQAVSQQIAATEEKIDRVEKSLEELSEKISTIEKEATELSNFVNNRALAMATFDDFHDRVKESFGSFDKFMTSKEAELARLDQEKSELRKKEDRLRQEKQLLLQKELKLMERQSEDRRASKRMSLGRNLHDVSWKLDAQSFAPQRFKFDFVRVDEYDKLFDFCKDSIEGLKNSSTDALMEYPVVDGASGSGKTRLSWEVCLALARDKEAISLFYNVETDKQALFAEKITVQDSYDLLAGVLLSGFFTSSGLIPPSINIDSALERLSKDNDQKSIVVILLDEYASNVELTKALIRACREYNKRRDRVCIVYPILSGIPFLSQRESLVVTSDKAVPTFFTLYGLDGDKIGDLELSFWRELSPLGTEFPSILRLVTAAFAGFPKLFYFLFKVLSEGARKYERVLRALRNGDEVTNDDLSELHSDVVGKYNAAYPMSTWASILRETPLQGPLNKDRPVSLPTLERVRTAIRRVHTVALTGREVGLDLIVFRDESDFKTIESLLPTGIFSLKAVGEGPGTKFVVKVPPLAIQAMSPETGVLSSPDLLSPTGYNWESLEKLSMDMLRAHWNAIWYIDGNTEVPVTDLRPGALFFQPKGVLDSAPLVKINGEALAAPMMVGSLGDAAGLPELREAKLTMRGQAGFDGIFRAAPNLFILNQCKSTEKSTRNFKPSDLKKIVESAEKGLKEAAPLLQDANIVFDLCVLKNPSEAATYTAVTKWPTMLTTLESFEETMGPLFAIIAEMVETRE